MAAQHWITWLEAVFAGVAGVFVWARARRLRASYLRDYLSDLAWTPAICLVVWACLGGDPVTALLSTLILAPVIALRDVLFALALRNPPNDPSGIPVDVRKERDELRAQLLPHDKASES